MAQAAELEGDLEWRRSSGVSERRGMAVTGACGSWIYSPAQVSSFRGLVFTSRRTGVLADQRRLAGHQVAARRRRCPRKGRDQGPHRRGGRGLTRRLRLGSVSTKMLRAGGPILVYTRAEI